MADYDPPVRIEEGITHNGRRSWVLMVRRPDGTSVAEYKSESPVNLARLAVRLAFAAGLERAAEECDEAPLFTADVRWVRDSIRSLAEKTRRGE